MKTRRSIRGFNTRAEQRALQQFHQRIFRRALKLARTANRRSL